MTEKLETLLFKVFRPFQSSGVALSVFYSCFNTLLHCHVTCYNNTNTSLCHGLCRIINFLDTRMIQEEHPPLLTSSAFPAFHGTALCGVFIKKLHTMLTINQAYIWALVSPQGGLQLLKIFFFLTTQLLHLQHFLGRGLLWFVCAE